MPFSSSCVPFHSFLFAPGWCTSIWLLRWVGSVCVSFPSAPHGQLPLPLLPRLPAARVPCPCSLRTLFSSCVSPLSATVFSARSLFAPIWGGFCPFFVYPRQLSLSPWPVATRYCISWAGVPLLLPQGRTAALTSHHSVVALHSPSSACLCFCSSSQIIAASLARRSLHSSAVVRF